MSYKQKLLAFQVWIHLWFLIGLLAFPLYVSIPVIVACQVIFVGLCGTVFFHRVVTHKNTINSRVEVIALLLSWLGGVSSALAWAGVHRKHHRFSDTDRDPHSPKFMGKWRTYWQLSNNDTDAVKYVPDLLRKRLYVFQHLHYWKVLLSIHVVGLFVLPPVLYWSMLVVPAFLMWFGGSMVNIYGHDGSGAINNRAVGLLVGGEGWHKNHHADPSNPWFQHRLDWGYYIYRAVQ